MNENTTPTGTETAALTELTGDLTTLVLAALNAHKLRNWEDAVFALALTINAMTTLAASRGNADREQYRERAKGVVDAALRAAVIPLPKEVVKQ